MNFNFPTLFEFLKYKTLFPTIITKLASGGVITDEKLFEQGKLVQEGADVKAELAKELNQFQSNMSDFGNPVEPNPLDHSQSGGFFKKGGEVDEVEKKDDTFDKGGKVGKKKGGQSVMMKAIQAEAKKIRAEKPSMKWTDCIKQASKNLKK